MINEEKISEVFEKVAGELREVSDILTRISRALQKPTTGEPNAQDPSRPQVWPWTNYMDDREPRY